MIITRLTVYAAALLSAHIAISGQTAEPVAARQSPGQAAPAKANPHAAVTADTKDAECVECHKDVTAKPELHAPAAAESCLECHVAPPAGKPGPMSLAKGATKDNTAPLCTSCHEAVGQRLKEAQVHGPVASGDCISCHDAHGSDFPLFLAASRKDSCLMCHDTVSAALGEKMPHAPAAQGCGICHDPHGSANPAQLRAAGNALCSACHVASPAPAAAGSAPALFGRDLPEAERKLVSDAGRIALDAMGRRGHPNMEHPVAGVPDPNDKTRMLSCVSCHQPHGAAGKPLLQFGLTSTMELCLKCHK